MPPQDISSEKFTIKLHEFDGPLDLLLDLIKQKKMSINDVSLSEIANNFINFVKENEFKLSEATSFLSVAATLMLIKSRSLLPKIIFEPEDETEIDDLKKSLKILTEFRKLSQIIQAKFGQNILYKKKVIRKREIKFSPEPNLNTTALLQNLNEFFNNIKIPEKTPEKKVVKQISLQEITKIIYHKISRYLKVNFHEIALSSDKKETAASFLVILELFRNGKINLAQSQSFGKIMIEKTEPDLIYKE